jgi:hypothetical protein
MRRRMPYLLLAAACGTTPVAGAESSSGQPTPAGSTTTDATTSTTESLPTASSSATAADETAGVAFIANPDGGLVHIECSHFEQDCPRGEKCSAWANDGGNAWNATHCVPIDANPDGIGDPCSVEVAPLSGVDSCERGSTCWFIGVDVNGEGAGRCVANCSGSLSAPTCEDPNSDCVLTRALALCIPNCNPVVPNPCGAGPIRVSTRRLRKDRRSLRRLRVHQRLQPWPRVHRFRRGRTVRLRRRRLLHTMVRHHRPHLPWRDTVRPLLRTRIHPAGIRGHRHLRAG